MPNNSSSICLGCGGAFSPFRSTHKYCSRKCYSKVYHEKNNVKPKLRVCLGCGKDFYIHRFTQKYCGSKCWHKEYHKKHKEKLNITSREHYNKHKKKLKDHVCPVCSTLFIPSRSNAKYCSHKCGAKIYRDNHKKKPKIHNCIVCGLEFHTFTSTQRHCSKKCWSKTYQNENNERYVEYREKNREKIKANAEIYREKNKDKIKAKQKAYCEKNKVKRKANHEEWYKTNSVKLKAKRAANKEERCRDSGHVYRILIRSKKHAPVEMTREEFVSWYVSKSKNCCYCGISENNLKYVDWIPKTYRFRLQIERINGDKNYELDNIDLACHTCNQLHQKIFSPKEVSLIAKSFITPKWKKLVL